MTWQTPAVKLIWQKSQKNNHLKPCGEILLVNLSLILMLWSFFYLADQWISAGAGLSERYDQLSCSWAHRSYNSHRLPIQSAQLFIYNYTPTCTKYQAPVTSRTHIIQDNKIPTFPKVHAFVCIHTKTATTTRQSTQHQHSSNHVIHSNNNSFKCFQRRHPHIVSRQQSCQITNKRI